MSLEVTESNAWFLVAEKHGGASRTRPESAALLRGYNYRVTRVKHATGYRPAKRRIPTDSPTRG